MVEQVCIICSTTLSARHALPTLPASANSPKPSPIQHPPAGQLAAELARERHGPGGCWAGRRAGHLHGLALGLGRQACGHRCHVHSSFHPHAHPTARGLRISLLPRSWAGTTELVPACQCTHHPPTKRPAPTCGTGASVGRGGRGTAGELSATGPRLRKACDTAGERFRLAARAGCAGGAMSASAPTAMPMGEAASPDSASTTAGGLCSSAAGAGMAGAGAAGVAAAGCAVAFAAALLGAAGWTGATACAALPLTAAITKSCAWLGKGKSDSVRSGSGPCKAAAGATERRAAAGGRRRPHLRRLVLQPALGNRRAGSSAGRRGGLGSCPLAGWRGRVGQSGDLTHGWWSGQRGRERRGEKCGRPSTVGQFELSAAERIARMRPPMGDSRWPLHRLSLSFMQAK